MTVEIQITHADGTTETIAEHLRSEVRDAANKQTSATARVPRSAVTSLSQSLDEDEDEVALVENGTEVFAGVLQDYQFRDTEAVLEIQSFEFLAKNAEPTKPKLDFSRADDSTIVQDAVDGVPGLSAGTIDTVETDVDTLFHHATRAYQIRFCRKLSKAEVRYNSDKTVDYLAPGTLGSDRTATTISPANQNLTESRVARKGGKNSKTHLRMLGSGGTSIDVVADAYSSGETQRWGRAVFKEVSDASVLRRLGKKLLSELSQDWIEFRATLTNLSDVRRGDTFTVDYPEKGVSNETLEVAEVTAVRDSSGESGTEKHYEAVLSSRSFARQRAFARQQGRISNQYRTGQTTAALNSPGANIPITTIRPGEAVENTFFIPEGRALYLWQFGLRGLDSTSSTEDTFAQLVANATNTTQARVIYEQNVKTVAFGNPLATIERPGSATIGGVRISNRGSTSVTVGGNFSFTFEQLQRV